MTWRSAVGVERAVVFVGWYFTEYLVTRPKKTGKFRAVLDHVSADTWYLLIVAADNTVFYSDVFNKKRFRMTSMFWRWMDSAPDLAFKTRPSALKKGDIFSRL